MGKALERQASDTDANTTMDKLRGGAGRFDDDVTRARNELEAWEKGEKQAEKQLEIAATMSEASQKELAASMTGAEDVEKEIALQAATGLEEAKAAMTGAADMASNAHLAAKEAKDKEIQKQKELSEALVAMRALEGEGGTDAASSAGGLMMTPEEKDSKVQEMKDKVLEAEAAMKKEESNTQRVDDLAKEADKEKKAIEDKMDES